MAEGLSVRERPDTGYYKELHNFTSDILYKTKKGKRRKALEDIYYEVERVISRRVTKGTSKYLIKWKDYSLFVCTWEDEEDLTPDLIRTYDRPPVNSERLHANLDTLLQAIVAKLKSKSRSPCSVAFHHDCYRHSFYSKGRPSQDGKSMLLDKHDFDNFNFFAGWDHCLDNNGDGVVIKYPIKIRTLLSWSPKVSVIQGGILSSAPRMPQEKLLVDFVRQPFSILL